MTPIAWTQFSLLSENEKSQRPKLIFLSIMQQMEPRKLILGVLLAFALFFTLVSLSLLCFELLLSHLLA